MTSIEKAINYYHVELKKSKQAKEYLRSRGITKESVTKFRLGYAPTNCSIARRFHDRIIFPIWDAYGDPIGWTGRTLIDAPAKYLNTRESALYQKSRVLYPYHLAKQAIAASGWAILVEGQMDAISLHQAGLLNTVAVSGTTSFKEAAMWLLARYAQRVFIVCDPDDAGRKATERATKFLKEIESTGVSIFRVSLPNGIDPDKFILQHGKRPFLELLKNALNK